jgi:hypothetical protein
MGPDSEPNAELFARLLEVDGPPDSTLGGGVVFAVFEGDTSGHGSYGHLGQYPRELLVHRIVSLERDFPETCGQ